MKLVAIRDLANVPSIGITVDPKSPGFKHPNHIHKGYKFTYGSNDNFDDLPTAEKEVVSRLIESKGVVIDDGSSSSNAAITKVEAEIVEDKEREKREKRAQQEPWTRAHKLQLAGMGIALFIAILGWYRAAHQPTSPPVVSEAKKIIYWQPPELDKRLNKVIVNYAPAQQVYEISNLASAIQFEINNSPYAGHFEGHHPMSVRVLNNRLYIDLQIPTPTKPIQIKDGEIIDLPDGWQCNTSSNALEVVNAEVIPVFQEFYTSPNTFNINGAIRSGDKVFYQDINHQIQFQEFQAGLYSEGGYENALSQYFAYPARENPGILFSK